MSIEARFTALHDRVDHVARNLLERIDHRFDAVTKELREFQLATTQRFEQIDSRFERIEGRLEQIDGRFEQIDSRFERIEGRLGRVEGDLGDIKAMLLSLGAQAPGVQVN